MQNDAIKNERVDATNAARGSVHSVPLQRDLTSPTALLPMFAFCAPSPSRASSGLAVGRQDSQTNSSHWCIHAAQVVQPSSHRGDVRQQRTTDHLRAVESHL